MAKKHAKSKRKGLRIGGVRIKPLGLVLMALLLLIIIGCVIFFVGKPTQVGGDGFLSPTATPTPTPTPSPTPTPTPTPVPTPRSATIRAIGEIAMQQNLLTAARTEDGGYDFSPMFSEISSVMGDADFTIADVEGSLGGTAEAIDPAQMLTPPSLIQTLKDCGVDMLNLANDHTLDGGWSDLQAAMNNCDAAGMLYVGAAKDQQERNAGKVYSINGILVGFVAYTDTVNGLENKTDAAAKEYGLSLAANSKPKIDIQACRDAGAEIVVACVSWGEMLNRQPTQGQQKMASTLADAGADIIIGYNPHVVQPALWLNQSKGDGRTLCLLSCGNFLSDSREKYSDSGVIYQITLSEESYNSGIQITGVEYIPTYVWRIENEDETKRYDYRTLAVGQWLETAPEGMNYTQESRMREVWAEAQSVLGTNIGTVAKQ